MFENVLDEGIRLLNGGLSVIGVKWERDLEGNPAFYEDRPGHSKKRVRFPLKWTKRQSTPYEPEEFLKDFSDLQCNTLCLVLGAVSNNLFCVDVDDPSRYDELRLTLMASIPNFFERTYIENTFSGGKHIVFAVDPMVKLPRNCKWAQDAEQAVIFETRGEHGIIFMAPSQGYERVSGDLLTLKDVALSAAEFETVERIVRGFNEYHAETPVQIVDEHAVAGGFDDSVTDEEIFNAPITSDPQGLMEAIQYTNWAVEHRQAVSGNNGSNAAMTYFNMVCWGLKVSPNDALSICQPWNAICLPPWPEEQLRHKIASAWRCSGKTRPLGYAIGKNKLGATMDFNGVSLRVDKHGRIINDLTTVMTILTEDPKYTDMAKFNELSGVTSLVKPVGYLPVGTLLTKNLRAYIICDINTRYDDLRVKEEDLKAALAGIFNANRYNPFRDFVESCEWDGEPRVDTLLIDAFECDDTPLAREAIRNWLIAAYARQVKPGMKFDYALTLTGVEGLGKSGFCKCLFDPLDLGVNGWNVDGMHLKRFTDDKIFVEDSKGKVGIELAEFAGSKKVEVEELKSAITKCSRQVRMAYGEVSEQFLIRQVYLVTTNEESFLQSLTGNRRFWIVKARCNHVFDLLTEEYVKQVWGEVKAMYDELCDENGVFRSHILELSKDAAPLAFEAQQNARIADTWEGSVARKLGTVLHYKDIEKVEGGIKATPVYTINKGVKSETLWTDACVPIVGKPGFGSNDGRRLKSFVVNKLGWDYRKSRIDGLLCNGLIRPESDYEKVFIPNESIPLIYQNTASDRSMIPGDKLADYAVTPKYWTYC